MSKTALDARRTTAYMLDPGQFVVIGLDTDHGPDHPLWDERINLPIDEGMILNIMRHGVKETVTARSIPDDRSRVEVVDGRRRVLHARVANQRLAASGEPLITVPVMLTRGSEEMLEEVSVSLNEIRVQDTVMTKAAKVVRMLSRNGSDYKAAAIAFGVSTQTIRNWENLLELSAKVRRAIDADRISPSAAVKLHGLTREVQEEELEKLTANGKATASAAGRASKGRRAGTEVLPIPSRGQLRKLVTKAKADDTGIDEEFLRGIRYAIGDLDAGAVKGLRGALAAIQ